VKKLKSMPETVPGGLAARDERPRHYVERVGGPTSPLYRDVALCGERVTELTPQHNGKVCQPCVDELRRRGRA